MSKLVIQYSVSAALIFAGLFSLSKAYNWKKNEIEKYNEFKHPPPKNYGRGYLVFLGLILFITGVVLLFLQKK
jgi:uncharacterized membrane protein HdeD (DUF308 family)